MLLRDTIIITCQPKKDHPFIFTYTTTTSQINNNNIKTPAIIIIGPLEEIETVLNHRHNETYN